MELEKTLEEIISYEHRSPYFDIKDSRNPSMIIIHTTNETFEDYWESSTENEIAVYTDKKHPLAHLKLSPHFMITTDYKFVDWDIYADILCIVDPKDVAHHAGKSKWNSEENLNECSIGIEIRGYTNMNLLSSQYNSLYALLEHLMDKHDIPLSRVLGHYQVAPGRKTDPGEVIMKNVWDEMIERLHKKSFTIDAHQDTILNVAEIGKDISVESDVYEVDIPRMRKGNLDVALFALFTKEEYQQKGERLKQLLKFFEKTMKDNSKELVHVKRYEDFGSLKDNLGIVLSVEGAAGIGEGLTLEELYDAGVRCLSLTHNPKNQYATGISGRKGRGVTRKGKNLIQKMDELGIVIDVSHLNEKSFWGIMKYSKNPVIASHSNCYAVKPHNRNLKDEQIKEIAKKDGVVGINFWVALLEKKNVEGVADHVDYIKNLVGIDHVGLGTDYDGVHGYTPEGLEDVSQLKNLTKELIKRGYANKEIRKFLGENYLRVFKKVWK